MCLLPADLEFASQDDIPLLFRALVRDRYCGHASGEATERRFLPSLRGVESAPVRRAGLRRHWISSSGATSLLGYRSIRTGTGFCWRC